MHCHRNMRLALLAALLPFSALAADRQLEPLLNALHQVSREQVELGHFAPSRTASVKVTMMADRIIYDFELLDAEVTGYAHARGIVLAPLPPDAGLEPFAELEDSDFDEAFFDAMVDRCESVLQLLEHTPHPSGDLRFEALSNRSFATLNGTRNDARRARGEYVPLSSDDGWE
jgi:predicted outer membrane protein